MRYDCLASTNDLAKEMAASGASEGVALLAREQTAGRGRLNRSWSSPPGEGLYLSLILRPQIKVAESTVLTLAAAVAVAETLTLDYQVAADIKWPNDILAGNRKICGILVESSIEQDSLQYAVLGIGVNLKQREFPPEITETATSLFLESGQMIEPEEFLPHLLERIETWYRLVTSAPAAVIARWQALSSFARDCQVSVSSREGVLVGTTRGLRPTGALLIELEDGQLREIVSGEVRRVCKG